MIERRISEKRNALSARTWPVLVALCLVCGYGSGVAHAGDIRIRKGMVQYTNVKTAIRGTYHAISKKHVPRYLAEFCYRFNRRFKLENMIPRLGYAAVRTPPMPQRLLSMAEALG